MEYASMPHWGESNRPGNSEFPIHEDSPEASAAHNARLPLGEGFNPAEENKENVEARSEHGSSSSHENLQPIMDSAEDVHRPRDAFGGPIDTGRLFSHAFLNSGGVYFTRGRNVLAPIAIREAEGQDDEERDDVE